MNAPALVGIAGPRLSPGEAAALRELRPVGVLLFRRNVEDEQQLRQLCADLRHELGEQAWIAADEEGGAVSVLRAALPSAPSALAMGMADDLDATRTRHRESAERARRLGVDLLLAPVADVVGGEHAVLATRSFGSDPARVARHVVAAIEGIQAAGLHACVKHWPGHGRPIADSHLELPTVEANIEQLIACELLPFGAALEAEVDCVMVGHLRVPALDPSGTVASASPRIVRDWLRERLGFGGLILADALEMEASTAPQEQLRAGCDAVLVARPIEQALELLRTLPKASDELLGRLVSRSASPVESTADPAVDARIRRQALTALWEDFSSKRPWPPFAERAPRVALFDTASSDRLVREPQADPLRADELVDQSRYVEILRSCGASLLGAPTLVAPGAAEEEWLRALSALPIEAAELLLIAGLRPWPAAARELLRGRLEALERPPALLLLGDPSPQAWLSDLLPLLLCPGLEAADLELALAALSGRVQTQMRDRWGF